jgi:hypothetical protein
MFNLKSLFLIQTISLMAELLLHLILVLHGTSRWTEKAALVLSVPSQDWAFNCYQ